MEKKLKVFFSDNKNWEHRQQQVWCDDTDAVDYNVYDMNDCPEDATIDRDLFTARQYINTIKLGMKLAEQGYTGLTVKEVPWED